MGPGYDLPESTPSGWGNGWGKSGKDTSGQGDYAALYAGDGKFLHALRKAQIQLYTYGSPRVGNQRFAAVGVGYSRIRRHV